MSKTAGKQSPQPSFSPEDRQMFHQLLAARRDMRHFRKDAHVDSATMQRLFRAAHMAPSVGLMQPWRFIRITSPELREQAAILVDREIAASADMMGERRKEFLDLKLEGVRECAELVAVVLAPDDGTLLGRRTLPEETALCSAACAIENMWLAARVENLGLGWVSLFDPGRLAALLNCPQGARPIALLCIGPTEQFYAQPMLVEKGWRRARDLPEVIFENGWPEAGR